MKMGALYIRVSTDKQEELSPDAQKRLLLEYAKNNGIIISNEYIFTENGISGRKADKRPEFQKMVASAKLKPKPFDTILLWKFSRFARNQDEAIFYKSVLRNKCGIDVVSISEPVADGMFGKLNERIIEWMDEFYSYNLSGEVIKGMTEKALRGGFQARPPLGYRIVERGKPPVIIPEEAKIIRIIFDRYVNNQSGFFDIARYLNALGIKTSHGKSFEVRSIQYIISNPTYCGMIRWNRTTTETNVIKDESEWIIAEGHHEAIISKELFDAAQERFKSTYKKRGARPSSTYRHWLSGLLKCPGCGRTMIAKTVIKKTSQKPYVYFSCYGYCKGKCATLNSVSSLNLEPVVLKSLKDVIDTRNIEFEYKECVISETLDESALLLEQLNEISAKEDRIKEAYRNGIDSIAEYKSNKEILTCERNDVLSNINKLNSVENASPINEKKRLLNRISSTYEIVISDNYTDAQKNEALKSVIEKIVYNRVDDELKIYYYLMKAL